MFRRGKVLAGKVPAGKSPSGGKTSGEKSGGESFGGKSPSPRYNMTLSCSSRETFIFCRYGASV